MGIGRELGKKLLGRASSEVGRVLSRADELGGKVRDRLSEKLEALKVPPPANVAPAPVSSVQRTVVKSPSPPPSAPPPSGLGDPNRPAQVFGRRSCPWSGRALALLESNRVEHSYFDLDTYGGDSVLRELKQETKQDTVPYVYLRGRFIGGYNALDEIQRLGQLEYLTLSDEERPKHPLHGRIEIAPRRHDGEHIPGA
jgi:glutaredoxin